MRRTFVPPSGDPSAKLAVWVELFKYITEYSKYHNIRDLFRKDLIDKLEKKIGGPE